MDKELVLKRITIDSSICGGKPVIRGMRIRVTDVLELMAAGLSMEQIVEELPDLEPDDVQACLLYVIQRFDHPVVITSSSAA